MTFSPSHLLTKASMLVLPLFPAQMLMANGAAEWQFVCEGREKSVGMIVTSSFGLPTARLYDFHTSSGQIIEEFPAVEVDDEHSLIRGYSWTSDSVFRLVIRGPARDVGVDGQLDVLIDTSEDSNFGHIRTTVLCQQAE